MNDVVNFLLKSCVIAISITPTTVKCVFIKCQQVWYNLEVHNLSNQVIRVFFDMGDPHAGINEIILLHTIQTYTVYLGFFIGLDVVICSVGNKITR